MAPGPLRRRPDQVAYIGDGRDNDVGPAQRAGLVAVHVRRGPWAQIVPGSGSGSDLEIDGLAELRERLREVDRHRRPVQPGSARHLPLSPGILLSHKN
jgi:phosphoglycolate phosphatase-like HAD superfamily hydrolase